MVNKKGAKGRVKRSERKNVAVGQCVHPQHVQ